MTSFGLFLMCASLSLWGGAPPGDREVTMFVAGLDCARCGKAIIGALSRSRGVARVVPEVKGRRLKVAYEHHDTSLSRIASLIAQVRPPHGKAYRAGLMLTADEIKPEVVPQVVGALTTFRNPQNVSPVAEVAVNPERKWILVYLRPVDLNQTSDRGTDLNPLLNRLRLVLPGVKAM